MGIDSERKYPESWTLMLGVSYQSCQPVTTSFKAECVIPAAPYRRYCFVARYNLDTYSKCM